jgi:hypothetical protein
MMSKDLENKIDDIDSRMNTLTKIVIEMVAEKEILNLVQKQEAAIIELSSHFACIADACT